MVVNLSTRSVQNPKPFLDGFHGWFVVAMCLLVMAMPLTLKAQGSEKFASIRELRSFGVKITPGPGVYDSAISVGFEVPDSIELLFRLNDDQHQWHKVKGNLVFKKPVTLRCRIKTSGTVHPITYCGSYIVSANHTLPVVCLTVFHNDFFPPNGIYVGHNEYDEDSVLISRGRAFQKEKIPCHVEFFFENQLVESGPIALKTFGGMTLGYPEKSLRVIGDSDFGKKKLKYKFFVSRPYNEFKSVVFRTSGNDQAVTRFKDIALSSVARDLGLDYMDYQPAVLYINGIYWGIHHLREKTGITYLKINHQADEDSLVLIQGSGMRHPDYLNMVHYMTRNYRNPDFAAIMDSRLDVDNYFNFIIFQIFNANVDSRGNIRFWKDPTLDNRYRWLFYDSDHSAGMAFIHRNFLADKLSPVETHWYNPPYSTIVIRSLVSNATLRDCFINQYALLLGSWLRSDSMTSRIENFRQWLEPEMPRHFKRRNHLRRETLDSWNRKVDDFKTFYQRMPAKAYTYIKEVFNLKDRWMLKVETNPSYLKSLKINESQLRFSHFTGPFFSGIPLSIEATSENHLYQFEGWKGLEGLHDIESETASRLLLDAAPYDTLNLVAVYTHIPRSSLSEQLTFRYFYTTMQTKNPLQWISWVNHDYYHLMVPPITLYDDIAASVHEIPGMMLEGYEAAVLCNDTASFLAQFPDFQGVLMEGSFPVQFHRDHQWVLVDSAGHWVDSLYVEIPERLLRYRNRFLASVEEDKIRWEAFDPHNDTIDFGIKPEYFIDIQSGRIPLTEEIYIGSAVLSASLIAFFLFQNFRK